MKNTNVEHPPLADYIAARIVIAHDALMQAVASDDDLANINDLILEIWSLAEEFDSAVQTHQVLAGVRARAACAGRVGVRRPL